MPGKVMVLVLALAVALSMVSGAGDSGANVAQARPAVQVFINGTRLEIEEPPVIQEGRTLVPMRSLFEGLGAEVEWDSAERVAIANKDDIEVRIPIDSKLPTVDGKTVEIEVAAQIFAGMTYIPLRFVGEALGGTVEWDPGQRRIDISQAASPEEPEDTGETEESEEQDGDANESQDEQDRYDKILETAGTLTPIVGKPEATVTQAQAWARSRGAHPRFVNIAPLYWEYGKKTGIRPDVLYAQSAKETAYGNFGGVLDETWNNWAGIKTREGGCCRDPEAHQRFPTPEEGVRAHFNHVSAYVGLDPIGVPHGRYHTVMSIPWAGTVKNVEDMGGRWAPSLDYGISIVRSYLDVMLRM